VFTSSACQTTSRQTAPQTVPRLPRTCQHGEVGFDLSADGDTGWSEDDPEYLLARIRAVAQSMSAQWRGRPWPVIRAELCRRLAPFGYDWPPELLEHLARDIADPHWPLKHPLQAWDLSRRFNLAARPRTR